MHQRGITWDASCNDPNPKNKDETKHVAVQRAWVSGLELINVTWTRFDTVTWPTITKERLSLDEQLKINEQDSGSVLVDYSSFSYSMLVANCSARIDTFNYLR